MSAKKHRIRINEETWTYRLLPDAEYNELHGTDSQAITDLEERTIDVAERGFNLNTMIHETFHAYKSYLCLDSAEMDNSAVEEIFASFFGKNSFKILEKAVNMYKNLVVLDNAEKESVKNFLKIAKRMDELCNRNVKLLE